MSLLKVASNSGPLIHLAKIKQLRLLRSLYGTVIITEAVKKEAVEAGKARGHADALMIENAIEEGWIKVEAVKNPPEEKFFRFGLNEAEAQVISHAITEKCDLLLLDDEAAREIARALGLRVRGSIGVLVEAVKKGEIGRRRALQSLEELADIMHLSLSVYRAARDSIQKAQRYSNLREVAGKRFKRPVI